MIEIREWHYIIDEPLHRNIIDLVKLKKEAEEAGGVLVLSREDNYALIEFDTKQEAMVFVLTTSLTGKVERNEFYDKAIEYRKKRWIKT